MHAVHRLESQPSRSHVMPPSISPVPTSEAHTTHSRSRVPSSAGDGSPGKSHLEQTKTPAHGRQPQTSARSSHVPSDLATPRTNSE